jgi:ribonuclease HII
MCAKNKKLVSCFLKGPVEAGCDEAGRGCLAGPVFAAAVVLPQKFRHKYINDSKQLSESKRYELRDEIERVALCWSVAHVGPDEIDRVNIYKASMIAMHRAITALKIIPEHLIVDGKSFIKYNDIPHTCIVEGDAKYLSIAAASILAKTYRDDYMKKIHHEYTCYSWNKNKGYATLCHRTAIQKHGISPYHRKSFHLFDDQLKFDFFD